MTVEAPRRTQMNMKDESGKSQAAKGERDARLAAALRANLRRRKAVTPAPAKPSKPGT